jgi:hypothetical protein
MSRLTFTRILVALVLATTGTTMAAGPVHAASPARVGTVTPADPGYCGVRSAGPEQAGAVYMYVAYNKCRRALYARIVVGGWRLYCQTIPPRGYASWVTVKFDPNWTIQNC